MILIIHCGSSKTPYIEDAVDAVCDYQTMALLDLKEKPGTEFAGIIISGAPILLTETEPQSYLEKIAWLSDYGRPVLGICFGHQLIGLQYGAFVSRQKEDRDWQTIAVLEDSILFDKLPEEFDMMEDHCETVSVPPGFKLIATSDACVNEGMQHVNKPQFGIQFHPEVSGNLGRILIENFVQYALRFKA